MAYAEPHREVLHRSPDWGAMIAAAIIAGLVFAALEMLLAWMVTGTSPWAPIRMIAAIGMGRGVLPPPDTFDLGIVAAGVAIHMVLSVVYAIVLAYILTMTRPGAAWWIGILFGLAIYAINFYGFTALFPWFAEARNWISIVSHAIFGLVLALVYRARDRRELVPANPPGPA